MASRIPRTPIHAGSGSCIRKVVCVLSSFHYTLPGRLSRALADTADPLVLCEDTSCHSAHHAVQIHLSTCPARSTSTPGLDDPAHAFDHQHHNCLFSGCRFPRDLMAND